MFKVCIAVFLAAHFSSFDKDTKNCVISCTISVNEKDCFTMSWGRLRMLLSTRKQVTYALNAILTALYLTSVKKEMSSMPLKNKYGQLDINSGHIHGRIQWLQLTKLIIKLCPFDKGRLGPRRLPQIWQLW